MKKNILYIFIIITDVILLFSIYGIPIISNNIAQKYVEKEALLPASILFILSIGDFFKDNMIALVIAHLFVIVTLLYLFIRIKHNKTKE